MDFEMALCCVMVSNNCRYMNTCEEPNCPKFFMNSRLRDVNDIAISSNFLLKYLTVSTLQVSNDGSEKHE